MTQSGTNMHRFIPLIFPAKRAMLVLLIALGGMNSLPAQPLPDYELDPQWPILPMGNNWLTGGLGGMCIDSRDHVYLLNRQNVVEDDLDGARLAPPILELDPAGNVVNAWGNPQVLGDRLHDCHVDNAGNVWIVAAATGYVQKFSPDGSELLLQIGHKEIFDSSDGTRQGQPLNSDRAQFFLPAAIDVDPENGDVYVGDGELPGGNSRIAVMNSHGEFLRQWRLRRNPGERSLIELPHCLRLSNDGLVYVCDRRADRIQVFDKQGNHQHDILTTFTPMSSPRDRTSGVRGSAVVLDFSPDNEQRFLYVVNQNSVKVEVLNRQTGEFVRSIGLGPGRYPGQFTLPHGIGVDSKGNVYVAEQEGRRVQKFLATDSDR